jgi:hypothetical protein
VSGTRINWSEQIHKLGVTTFRKWLLGRPRRGMGNSIEMDHVELGCRTEAWWKKRKILSCGDVVIKSATAWGLVIFYLQNRNSYIVYSSQRQLCRHKAESIFNLKLPLSHIFVRNVLLLRNRSKPHEEARCMSQLICPSIPSVACYRPVTQFLPFVS